MRKKEILQEKEFYFKDEMFNWSPVKRRIYQILVLLLLIWSGILTGALIIIVRSKWQYLGILLAFFLTFILLKKNYSDLTLDSRNLRGKKINLAPFLSPEAKSILLKVSDMCQKFPLDKEILLFLTLIRDNQIRNALLRLDVSLAEIQETEKKLKLLRTSTKRTESNTEFCLRLLQLALKEALENGYKCLNKESLFLSLFELENKNIEEIFSSYKINKVDVRTAFLLNRLAQRKRPCLVSGLTDVREKPLFQKRKVRVNRALTSRPTPLLDKYGVDLTELAEQLKIGIMIGHRREYRSLINLLSRPDKRNVLLVGATGAGKDTLVSYLAYNLSRDNVPPELKDFRVIKLSLSKLFSSQNKPLEVFNLLSKIIQEFEFNKDIILYLPHFHNWKLLGQYEGGVTALDVLKPLINSTWIPIIGAVSDKEYYQFLETDSFISENFTLLRIEPVKSEEAIQILAYKSLDWERKERVKISYRAIKRAVELAIRYFPQFCLPSSAEELLLEALRGIKAAKKKILTEQDIVNLVSTKTKIPLTIDSKIEKEKLLVLEQLIHQYLINQEEAVKLVAQAMRIYRAGLSSGKKPIAVFLFVGPTGVGKTELAKTLARIYFGSGKAMIRFDMAEYQFRESLIQFIGSPDGKIKGALTEAVKLNPFSLILLDEFEKAHPDILNLFLSVFDEGRLMDNRGRVIDFTNTIIIATSNALSGYIKRELEKGTDFAVLTKNLKQKLTDYFKPELLNRFQEVVIFKPLTKENLRAIVKLKLDNFARDILQHKGIYLEFDSGVLDKLAELGYSPIFGARPLNSVIRHFIKEPLAEKILRGEIQRSEVATFSLRNNRIELIIQEKN